MMLTWTTLLFASHAFANHIPTGSDFAVMRASEICPLPTRATALTVIRPLQVKRFAWFRRQHALNVNHRKLMTLQSPDDAAACTRLHSMFKGSPFDDETTVRAYYKAEGYYFASFVDMPDPRVRRPWASRMFVLDNDFKVLATIAPKMH